MGSLEAPVPVFRFFHPSQSEPGSRRLGRDKECDLTALRPPWSTPQPSTPNAGVSPGRWPNSSGQNPLGAVGDELTLFCESLGRLWLQQQQLNASNPAYPWVQP